VRTWQALSSGRCCRPAPAPSPLRAPVTTIARTCSEAAQSSSRPKYACSISSVQAFSRCGRLSVSRATPSSTVMRTTSLMPPPRELPNRAHAHARPRASSAVLVDEREIVLGAGDLEHVSYLSRGAHEAKRPALLGGAVVQHDEQAQRR